MAPAQFEADFETYHRAGLQVHTHTNGDEASAVAIDAIERVLVRAARSDHRHTLQHGQMIDAAMFRRMAALGIGVNLFANHLWYWGDQHYEVTMGPDRANRLDACASALAAGVPLAIHSDAPVTPLGPLFTAWCRPTKVFEVEALRAWLKAPPPDLLRLKGVLRTRENDGTEAWSQLQFAGRHGTLHAMPAPSDTAALVAIGLRGKLPRDTLSTFFEASS